MDNVKNNAVNLCESCDKQFADCSAKVEDMLFGDGKGNDNVCCCNRYEPMRTPIRNYMVGGIR